MRLQANHAIVKTLREAFASLSTFKTNQYRTEDFLLTQDFADY